MATNHSTTSNRESRKTGKRSAGGGTGRARRAESERPNGRETTEAIMAPDGSTFSSSDTQVQVSESATHTTGTRLEQIASAIESITCEVGNLSATTYALAVSFDGPDGDPIKCRSWHHIGDMLDYIHERLSKSMEDLYAVNKDTPRSTKQTNDSMPKAADSNEQSDTPFEKYVSDFINKAIYLAEAMKAHGRRVGELDEQADEEDRKKYCAAFYEQWQFLAYRAEQLKDEIDERYLLNESRSEIEDFQTAFRSFVCTADVIVGDAVEYFGRDEPYISTAIQCDAMVDFAKRLYDELTAAINADCRRHRQEAA